MKPFDHYITIIELQIAIFSKIIFFSRNLCSPAERLSLMAVNPLSTKDTVSASHFLIHSFSGTTQNYSKLLWDMQFFTLEWATTTEWRTKTVLGEIEHHHFLNELLLLTNTFYLCNNVCKVLQPPFPELFSQISICLTSLQHKHSFSLYLLLSYSYTIPTKAFIHGLFECGSD